MGAANVDVDVDVDVGIVAYGIGMLKADAPVSY